MITQAKSELDSTKNRLQDMEKDLKILNNEKREAETNALLAKSQLATYKQNMEKYTEQQRFSFQTVALIVVPCNAHAWVTV